MEKINIAELLKDCPKGMELDCTMYDNCTFEGIEDVGYIDILVKTPRSGIIRLTKEGCYIRHDDYAKCVIFPKGKTTWEGFQRPFRDGDIVFYNDTIAIFKEWGDETLFRTYAYTYLGYEEYLCKEKPVFGKGIRKEVRFAAEEEKQKLFQVIKDNGYKWNEETKTLEGLITLKFKVGDKIRRKNGNDEYIITSINDYTYYYRLNEHCTGSLGIQLQDEYELVPNKFDITTLKPFDKVLVRTKNFTPVWTIDFYDGYQPNIGGSFTPFGVTSGKYFQQCIPYEGNEHLRGTTNDCDEYFKTWK